MNWAASTLSLLEWSGCALGLIGAFLLATHSRYSKFGWLAFFAANVAMIGLALGIGRTGLLMQQLGFTATSLLGIYRSPWKKANTSNAAVTNQRWMEQAYPLQQIAIELQGARQSDRAAVIDQLEEVLARLRSGELQGAEHDDDFGYRFDVIEQSSKTSYFDTPSGSR